MEKLKQFFATQDLFAKHVGIELLEIEPVYATPAR